MMTKIIPPDSYDFGEPASQLVKVAASGLSGNDFRALVKRAGYIFANQIRDLDLKPGDVPVHDIIIGATEKYGNNRNGDAFGEAACRKYHDTFVKHARCYRHHQAKDPHKSYGVIKLSAYSDDMHRIELVSVYNGTKAAADRNGGLIADEELEKLAAGKDIPTSMACSVPVDFCNACGNRARNRSEYCRGIDEGGSCPGGGLLHKMGTVTGDDRWPILHADNRDPKFFDKSMVVRGADRTAFAMGFDKAASALPRGGAALAELLGVTAPAELYLSGASASLYKLAERAAELERQPVDGWRKFAAAGPAPDWTPPRCPPGELLAALAAEKIVMPVEGFLAALLGKSAAAAARAAGPVRDRLPGIYGDLTARGELADLLAGNPFAPAAAPGPDARRWAAKLAAAASLNREAVEARSCRAAIHLGCAPAEVAFSKTAALSQPADQLAKHYALYQLTAIFAAVDRCNSADDLLKSALAQNRVRPI